jgi:phosphoglycerate dehydrogenase-like enzyme
MKILITSPSFAEHKTLMGELSQACAPFPHEISIGLSKDAPLLNHLSRYPADVLLVGLEKIDDEIMRAAPQLKFVAKYGVGLDNIDTVALQACGTQIGWTPGVNKRSVSELVLSFAMGHCRNVVPSIQLMKNGQWVKSGGRELSGVTFGIVGLGNIGLDLAQLLRAFGTTVNYCDVRDRSSVAAPLGCHPVSFEKILQTSDIISFHVPSSPSTRGMLNKENISLLRSDALVINTSRGDIVEWDALIHAAQKGFIGGFAADVYPTEPHDARWSTEAKNLYFTPHIGGNSKEAVLAMGRAAIGHIKEFLANRSRDGR